MHKDHVCDYMPTNMRRNIQMRRRRLHRHLMAVARRHQDLGFGQGGSWIILFH